MRFKDKVAIVTGAAQGIGETYAKSLAAEGAAVVVADLNDDQGRRVASEITRSEGQAIFVQTDVSSEESCSGMSSAAIEAFGGIDYLVNNAAIYGGMRMEPLLTVDLDYYRRFMDVNMHGCLLATRACFQSMAARGGGAIVNQSSTAAYMAGNYYGIAKLGLHGLTTGLARELGPQNIRINAIAPGTVDTEATRTTPPKEIIDALIAQAPLARIGTTEDIAKACLFLLSDDASWITGKIFCVDGGQVLLPI